jgi:cytidine deaminase
MSQELVEAAQMAREQAYAPYSDFTVGAAVLAGSGSVYTGCNVENASYGLTVCAERVAAFKAVSAGEREIAAVAVVSEPGATPCGACRQVLVEFTSQPEQVDIIVVNGQGDERFYTLGQLLPANFSGQELGLLMASAQRAGEYLEEEM